MVGHMTSGSALIILYWRRQHQPQEEIADQTCADRKWLKLMDAWCLYIGGSTLYRVQLEATHITGRGSISCRRYGVTYMTPNRFRYDDMLDGDSLIVRLVFIWGLICMWEYTHMYMVPYTLNIYLNLILHLKWIATLGRMYVSYRGGSKILGLGATY